jgi:hypothetical protein
MGAKIDGGMCKTLAKRGPGPAGFWFEHGNVYSLVNDSKSVSEHCMSLHFTPGPNRIYGRGGVSSKLCTLVLARCRGLAHFGGRTSAARTVQTNTNAAPPQIRAICGYGG